MISQRSLPDTILNVSLVEVAVNASILIPTGIRLLRSPFLKKCGSKCVTPCFDKV